MSRAPQRPAGKPGALVFALFVTSTDVVAQQVWPRWGRWSAAPHRRVV